MEVNQVPGRKRILCRLQQWTLIKRQTLSGVWRKKNGQDTRRMSAILQLALSLSVSAAAARCGEFAFDNRYIIVAIVVAAIADY